MGNKKILICILVIFLTSCGDKDKSRLIGTLPVKGIDNVSIRVYQIDEFDSATTLEYSIVDNTGKIILPKTFLSGTLDYFDDIKDFHCGSYDSIVYLSIVDSNDIDAIYDIKSHKGSYLIHKGHGNLINDSLFLKLKGFNPKFKNGNI